MFFSQGLVDLAKLKLMAKIKFVNLCGGTPAFHGNRGEFRYVANCCSQHLARRLYLPVWTTLTPRGDGDTPIRAIRFPLGAVDALGEPARPDLELPATSKRSTAPGNITKVTNGTARHLAIR